MSAMLVGAVCGLAWAAGLRAYMTAIAGAESTVSWVGTMAGVLAPGLVVGALLGWAEHVRRSGGRARWRWLALSPLLLAAAPLALPGALGALVTTGLGGGALLVVLIGYAGGYALCGRGSIWARRACGAGVLLFLALWVMMGTLSGVSALAVDTPAGALNALHFCSLLAVLALACAIPLRPVAGLERPVALQSAAERA